MILLSTFSSCLAQIKVNESDRKRAKESDVVHFFVCMTSNSYYEKVAKNNYYIFDSIEGYLYYGKVHPEFFNSKITDIFKVDIDVLQRQIPNFEKLHGTVLMEIVLSDISNENKILNKSEIIVKNISYQLDNVLIVSIDFAIRGKEQHKMYKLNAIDFSIIN